MYVTKRFLEIFGMTQNADTRTGLTNWEILRQCTSIYSPLGIVLTTQLFGKTIFRKPLWPEDLLGQETTKSDVKEIEWLDKVVT